jgi:hypothetical protein
MQAARSHDLDCAVDVQDRIDGTVHGTFRGPAGPVAWIAESLLDGRLDGQRAMLLECRHGDGKGP